MTLLKSLQSKAEERFREKCMNGDFGGGIDPYEMLNYVNNEIQIAVEAVVEKCREIIQKRTSEIKDDPWAEGRNEDLSRQALYELGILSLSISSLTQLEGEE